jgi:hypothetical protein
MRYSEWFNLIICVPKQCEEKSPKAEIFISRCWMSHKLRNNIDILRSSFYSIRTMFNISRSTFLLHLVYIHPIMPCLTLTSEVYTLSICDLCTFLPHTKRTILETIPNLVSNSF